MRLLTFLGLLFCIFHASASFSKDVDVCEKYGFNSPELPRCLGKNCPKLFQTPPSQFKNLKLAAACNYQIMDETPGNNREVGAFFFQGEQIISGVLRREPSEFINEFTLRGEEKTPWPAKTPVFFRQEIYLQFSDALTAEKMFRTPKPNKRTSCWEAKVKLIITEMNSIFGWDNIEGDTPLKYSVLEVGPYQKCLNPTPDPFAQ
jgi:hypothetical protein